MYGYWLGLIEGTIVGIIEGITDGELVGIIVGLLFFPKNMGSFFENFEFYSVFEHSNLLQSELGMSE